LLFFPNEHLSSDNYLKIRAGFPRFLESPGIVFVKFPGLGKCWKMSLELESPSQRAVKRVCAMIFDIEVDML